MNDELDVEAREEGEEEEEEKSNDATEWSLTYRVGHISHHGNVVRHITRLLVVCERGKKAVCG